MIAETAIYISLWWIETIGGRRHTCQTFIRTTSKYAFEPMLSNYTGEGPITQSLANGYIWGK